MFNFQRERNSSTVCLSIFLLLGHNFLEAFMFKSSCCPLHAPIYCPFPFKWGDSCALIKLSAESDHLSALNRTCKTRGRFLPWSDNKTAEWKKSFYNIMKMTDLERIHLVKKSFFFHLQSILWTFSLGESHCAVANSKKCLFCKSPLESGSKAFPQRLNLWLKYLILAPGLMQRCFLHSLAFPLHLVPPVFCFAVPPSLIFPLSRLFSSGLLSCCINNPR